MVVFLDLDDDVPDDPHADPHQPAGFTSIRHLPLRAQVTKDSFRVEFAPVEDERSNPNLNAVSAALGCYPIISLITQNIDLNTLHALSRTCRQIRSNILQYHTRLIQCTLHCENEVLNQPPLPARAPSTPKWHILGEAGALVVSDSRFGTSTTATTTCARDLVSDCRRCGRIICRNCTIKPPSTSRLPSRHRRLCHTCVTAPLSKLMSFPIRSPCTCVQSIHLCTPCGAKLATADTTYRRVWTWRTRYTTYLGGLGTGIGEGNEGVNCARGKECLGAKDVEVEFECPTNGGTAMAPTGTIGSGSSRSSSSSSSNSNASSSGGGGHNDGGNTSDTTDAGEMTILTPISSPPPRASSSGSSSSSSSSSGNNTSREKAEAAGYWRQEIEGLGGVVKKKFRKRERVGRTVREWEDEREGNTEILGREKDGAVRSWCGWCGRVVLGKSDTLELVENGHRFDSGG